MNTKSLRHAPTLLCIFGLLIGTACNPSKKDGVGEPAGTARPSISTSGDGRPALRFDGLYCSKVRGKGEDDPVPEYFRFYRDGRFVNEAVLGEPHEVAAWIRLNAPGPIPGDGVYTVQGDRIRFDFPKNPGHDPADGEWFEWVGRLDAGELEVEMYENTKSPPSRKLLRKVQLEFFPVKFGHE